MTKIALDAAELPQLRYYARDVLNLDVAATVNGPTLRAKILQAQPDLTEIDVPDSLVTASPNASAAPAPVAPVPAQRSAPAGRAGLHSSHDPKVTLMIHPTQDKTRPKDVQLAVNDHVILIKRGSKVEIPYRHYLALDAAVEDVAVDSDDINPATGLPFKIWQEQHSYPFQVYSQPSQEEVDAWQERTSKIKME